MKPNIYLSFALFVAGGLLTACSGERARELQRQELMDLADSIAAVEKADEAAEKARLDSIAKEEGKRRNFSSPDLDFFNLHGAVKEMTVRYPGQDDWNSSLGGWWLWKGTYKFSEDGTWTNFKSISDLRKIKRDSKNRITKIIIPPYYDDLDFDVISYSWDGNRLKSVSDRFNDGTLHFKDGDIISFNYSVSPGEGKGYWIMQFNDFEYDDNGNWISCKWHGDYHDDYGDRASDDGKILRTITYYE